MQPQTTMAEWSNEKILFFLECYQGEAIIWDPNHKQHKDKKRVADAWERLGVLLDTPSKELKVKKDVLMGTFRRHLKKKQDSIRSGAGAEEVYEPIWFAYPLMESFLLPVYTPKTTIDTEMEQSQEAQESLVDQNNESEWMETSISMDETQSTTSTTSAKKSRRRPAPEQQMAAAFSQLTNALSDHQTTPPADDDCDLYGKLLASKLRQFSKDERQLIMYDIDGIFIQRILNKARLETRLPQSPSPYSRLLPASPYSRPPSSSSNSRSSSEFNFDIPNRPSTAQNANSEPSTSRLNEPMQKKKIYLDQPPFAKSPKTSIPMSVQIEIDQIMQSPGTDALKTPLSVAQSQQPVKVQHQPVKILCNKKIKILPQPARSSTCNIQRPSESLQSMDTNSLQIEPGETQQQSQSPSEPPSRTSY